MKEALKIFAITASSIIFGLIAVWYCIPGEPF